MTVKKCIECKDSFIGINGVYCNRTNDVKNCPMNREKKKEEIEKPLYEYMPRTLEIQTIEELSELIQSISKLYRYGFEEKTCNSIYEELADVYLMLDIFKAKYDICEDIIDKNKEFKLKRLKQRIKEDLEITGGTL